MSYARYTWPKFLLGLMLVLLPCSAQSETFGYYAPPSLVRTRMEFAYSDSTSPHFTSIQSALIRFTNSTASFRFNAETQTLSDLRLAIASGSLSSPDRDMAWTLLGANMFDVNNFEEIVLEMPSAVTLKNNKGSFEANLKIRGTTKPIKLNATINAVKDSSLGFGLFGKSKTVSLTLRGTIKLGEYSMFALSTDSKNLGDQLLVAIDMEGARQ